MYVFDSDTQVEQVGENLYHADLNPRWNIGDAPNGGYMMAVAARAIGASLPHPDLLTISGFYLQRGVPTAAELHIEPMHQGKSLSTASVKLVQEGVERARFTASFTDFDYAKGPDYLDLVPPNLPPFEDCVKQSASFDSTNLRKQFDYSYAPDAPWLHGKLSDSAEITSWIQFADGRPPDLYTLPLVCDSFFPVARTRIAQGGWVPTLELTVQLRARPAPGPLLCRMFSNSMTRGYMEEDGEFWDSSGQLIGLSRQLARFRM